MSDFPAASASLRSPLMQTYHARGVYTLKLNRARNFASLGDDIFTGLEMHMGMTLFCRPRETGVHTNDPRAGQTLACKLMTSDAHDAIRVLIEKTEP